MPLSEVKLCYTISRYLKLISQKAVIVFDGTGPVEKGRFENINNLEVIFSGSGVEADQVIEERIKANTAPKRLTVVSTDRRLQVAAKAAGANTLTSSSFWESLCKRLVREDRKKKEPAEKRTGITESETEQWLKIFGFEQ